MVVDVFGAEQIIPVAQVAGMRGDIFIFRPVNAPVAIKYPLGPNRGFYFICTFAATQN